jgi:hypothetical protein
MGCTIVEMIVWSVVCGQGLRAPVTLEDRAIRALQSRCILVPISVQVFDNDFISKIERNDSIDSCTADDHGCCLMFCYGTHYTSKEK